MFTIKRAKLALIVAAVLYVFMIVMNALAVLLPLNGLTTQEVSARYDTLFAPTGLTFSIWGVIYALLLLDLVRGFLKFRAIADDENGRLMFVKHLVIAATSLINGIWIVFWHYELLLISLIDILILFALLAFINVKLKKAPLIERLPASVYFGWVTIALIANVSAYIVSLGVQWNNVGAVLQTSFIIVIAGVIAAVTVYLQKDFAYGLVIIWALVGIIIRHFDVNQFDLGYVSVPNFAFVAIGLVTLGLVAIPVLPKLFAKKSAK